MPNHDSERIELEAKTAFLERTVDELSEVVVEQGRAIEVLVRRITRLEGRVSSVAEGAEQQADPLDERPPHY